uniref:Phytosulfokine n=1 Tax=Nicotiana tabacum TaxID=4097 RepID=A0A1S3Z7P0_TOBAC|nr:PREDICTED: phytosulfokines 2-like [Nicotiana tabacum]
MSKFSALFIVAILLCFSLKSAAHPDSTLTKAQFKKGSNCEAFQEVAVRLFFSCLRKEATARLFQEAAARLFFSYLMHDDKVENDEGICGGAEEEDCLKRRTMEAHIDYIYTQSKDHP